MRHIPFPTYDLQAPMKASPERVDAMVRRMQDCLQRNSNPRSYASRGKNFRLTQVWYDIGHVFFEVTYAD